MTPSLARGGEQFKPFAADGFGQGVEVGDAFCEPVEFLAGDLVMRRVARLDIGAAQEFEIAVIGFAAARPGVDQPPVSFSAPLGWPS